MALITENDQRIINSLNSAMQQAGGALRGARTSAEQIAGYRQMMLTVQRFVYPPGTELAPVASFEPTRMLRPGLTGAVAIPQGAGPFPVLVHAHGRGLVAGKPPEYAPWICELASHGFVVVFPDYGWQPEITFQQQVDEMLFAVAWVKQNAAQLKVEPEKIVLGGDSMGASLALEVLFQSLENPSGPRFKAFISVDGEFAAPANSFGMGNPRRDRISELKTEMPLPPFYFMDGSADPFGGASTSSAIAKLQSIRKDFAADFAYGMPHDYAKMPNTDAGRISNARMMQFLKAAV